MNVRDLAHISKGEKKALVKKKGGKVDSANASGTQGTDFVCA